MIDTIVLLFDYPDFEVFEPQKFYPNALNVLNLRRYPARAEQRQPKHAMLHGEYKPQLTLHKRPIEGAGVHIYLVVQFSIPKLMFGNNFDEVSDEDYGAVVNKLQKTLQSMGVKISVEAIRSAHVSTIHFGKNFVLTDYTTPYTYIEEIRKANISRIYDVNQSDFRNEGHGYKFRSNTLEVTFYDKVKDLEKAKISPKRSLEKNSSTQTNLVAPLREMRALNPFEVLRFEIRLNGSRKIKTELHRLGIDLRLTFESMFSKSLAQAICLDHLEQIKSKLISTIGKGKKSFTENLSDLIAQNPYKKPDFLFTFAAFQEVVDEHDVRTARQLIDPKNTGKWYRLKKEFETVNQPAPALKIDVLIEQIKEFKTERLSNYSQFC